MKLLFSFRERKVKQVLPGFPELWVPVAPAVCEAVWKEGERETGWPVALATRSTTSLEWRWRRGACDLSRQFVFCIMRCLVFTRYHIWTLSAYVWQLEWKELHVDNNIRNTFWNLNERCGKEKDNQGNRSSIAPEELCLKGGRHPVLAFRQLRIGVNRFLLFIEAHRAFFLSHIPRALKKGPHFWPLPMKKKMECSCYIFPEEILGNFWDNTLLRSLFLQLVWTLRYSIPKPQNSYISNLPSLVEPLPSRLLRKEAELPGRVHCTESSGSVFHAPPSPPPPPLPRYFSAFTCLEIIKTVCFFVL